MKYSSIAIIAIAAAAKLMATSGAPTGKDVLLDTTDQSRLLGKGGKKDKGLKRQVQQLEAKVVELTKNLQECNDDDECNELRPTFVDYSLEKYGDDYCQYLVEKSNGNTLEVCNHICPIKYSGGWLIPGNCDATGKCVAACTYNNGDICGQGQEWVDAYFIANEDLCQSEVCEDRECDPIDISNGRRCYCQNSPYCVPENDGVGELPLPYKCQATQPVCLKLGEVCRTDYSIMQYDGDDYSYGDCCGNYCSFSENCRDDQIDVFYDKYTCQENQVFKRG